MLIVLLVPTAKMMHVEINMKHFDYDWDLYPNKIILDQDLDIDKLGWGQGDYFKFVAHDGRKMLVKVDVTEKFLVDGIQSGEEQ